MEKPLSSFPFGSGPDRNASLNSSRWAPFERFPDFGPDRHSPGPCPQSTLLEQAHWGDILLFRCMTLPAAVFRAVSLCNWDHVGVVVTNKDGKLLLLEAGVDGTVVCPLERRLTEYRQLFDQISWRRLRRTQPVADEPTVVAAMHQFVADVEGFAPQHYLSCPGWCWHTVLIDGLTATALGNRSPRPRRTRRPTGAPRS